MEVNISESFTEKAVISSTPQIVVRVKKTPELVIDKTGQYFSGNYCKFTGQSFDLKNEVKSLEFCADKCLKNEICDVFTYNSNFSKRICSLKELKNGTLDYDAFLNCGYIVGRNLIDIIRYLIEEGVDVNQKTKKNCNPLLAMAVLQKEHKDFMKNVKQLKLLIDQLSTSRVVEETTPSSIFASVTGAQALLK